MALKTIDFRIYTGGNNVERRAVAEELLAGLVKDGAIKLANYGTRQNLAAECLGAARDFFSIPLEEKLAIANTPGPNPQRGFSVVGVEQTSILWKENLNGHQSWEALRDAREHFDAGPPGDKEFPNRWPEDVRHQGLRSQIESLYMELQQISEQIISAIEMGLGLSTSQLVSYLQPASSEIRLNHYPLISLKDLAEGSVKRTWPHTDFGIISLIFQDQIGGLEIEDRSTSGLNEHKHSFTPVAPGNKNGPPEVVVLASDTLQYITNDVITAGRHQVSVPSSMKNQAEGECPERYSAVFFVKAARAVSIAPLSQFVTDARPAAYKDISALGFQQRGTGRLYGITESVSQTTQV